ncbi:MAG: hypothetical protein HQK88_01550 [Nitrospirae bacterium]|nr:hypothetical protein [Nitrospirota bacterium]MBF0615482.1 hypothetical protein [Nitrospirota bacterium]
MRKHLIDVAKQCTEGSGMTTESIPIPKIPDCPYCGDRFESPGELFDHVLTYHSC